MKSPMLPGDHQAAVRRALALGRSGNPTALPELVAMLQLTSNEVQRLGASAIGKLVEFGADADVAVAALAPLALKARHPQTQQYAIRALKKCGPQAGCCVQDLRDLARNPAQRDYVRAAAATAGERRIAEWLTAHCIAYRYDAKFRIIGEFQIRPDFYLPELDVYIEYWGLDTPQYKMSMYKKQTLYQQEGKRLVSVFPADLPQLAALLAVKLRRYGYALGRDARTDVR